MYKTFKHSSQRISLSSLSTSHSEALDEGGDTEVDFESLPIGLQTWRIAVATATSPAQLMLCVIQLNKSIAWEKSIMKVVSFVINKLLTIEDSIIKYEWGTDFGGLVFPQNQ